MSPAGHFSGVALRVAGSSALLRPVKNAAADRTGPDGLPSSWPAWLGAVVGFWIAAAAVTGFLHGVELLVARYGFGRLVWFSREFAWMSPIAYALVMAPGAVLLVALSVTLRRTWALSLSAAVFATISLFGLLLPYSQISRLASLILAFGVGMVIARAVQDRPALWVRRSRVAAIAGLAAVAVVAPGQRLLAALRESRALASLPVAASNATNVLVIILDTVRAASMGLYSPADSTTPRLDEWSGSGVVFDWAFSTAPWTLPAHGSMFTGAWAGNQSGDWERPLDRTLPTLAERFRARGYLTAGFVGNMHYTAWDSGLSRGFAHYEDYVVNWGQLVRSSSYTQTALFVQLRDATSLGEMARAFLHPNLGIDPKHRFEPKRGDAVTDAFLDWQAANRNRPFFAFLNYFDAHQPYYAPPEFRHFSGARGLSTYRAAIAFLDAEIDRTLVALRERGVLDQTLVIVTSDHGELFAFKGLSGHAHNVYLNTIRVPLFIRLPGRVPRDLRVAHPVSLRDLAATILDLTAAEAPALPGTSLATTWTGRALPSPVLAEVSRARNIESRYPTSRGDLTTLLDERWQLIRNGDARLELYDYRADTLQERDLAGSDSAADIVAAMKQRLQDLLLPRR